jgi:hypothetical protein
MENDRGWPDGNPPQILNKIIEKCRQNQEEYLIRKNQEPVQLSLFKLNVAHLEDPTGLDPEIPSTRQEYRHI